MAKIVNEIKMSVGEDGVITLKEPSNREWNDFQAECYPVGKSNKIKNNATLARSNLFDRLVINIENIEDDNGPITLETKDRIPGRRKAEIIFKAFESGEDIDVKNS